MEIYPRAKSDRRLLPHIPSKNTCRRCQRLRYLADLDVEVFDPEVKRHKIAGGRVVDISDTGLAATLSKPFALGDKAFLKFFLSPGAMPESFESFIKLPATVARVDEATGVTALHFDKPLSQYLRKKRWRQFEMFSLFGLFLTFLLIAYIKQDSVFYFWFDVPVFVYGLCAVSFLLSRFLFAACYRSYKVDPAYQPSVTIVIPCFNEEEWIHETIRTSFNQDYPDHLLEVIVVDDGSTDGSLRELYKAQKKLEPVVGDRLKIIPLPHNQGKRHALAAGTRIAAGEMVIFVDSDSFLQPDAVTNLVQPLKDPKIAAATGRCEVANKWTNFLTKMQAVRYFIGFRIFKAAESIFEAVTCLSGPLSCYRKRVVMECLDAWTNQTFLGRPATFGDDRSLTNLILRNHRTVYQHTAVCSTIVPSQYKKFYRQQMRWKRSWVRESLLAMSFIWKTEPFMAISFVLGTILPLLAPIVVLRAFVYVPLVYGTFPFMYLIGIFLMSMLMCTAYLFLKKSNLWFYGSFFCFFYLFVLLWQVIPASLTFWKSDWGTRPSSFDADGAKAGLTGSAPPADSNRDTRQTQAT